MATLRRAPFSYTQKAFYSKETGFYIFTKAFGYIQKAFEIVKRFFGVDQKMLSDIFERFEMY